MAQTFRNEKRTPLWKILYNSMVMIIAFAIVGAILGFGVNKLFSKPVYTAMQSFILRMEITEENSSNENADNASLAKIYLPDVSAIATSPDVEKKAQESYGDGTVISRNNVVVSYGEKSMILIIGYKDTSSQIAIEKLSNIVEATNFYLMTDGLIEAKDVSLVEVQNDVNVSVSSNMLTYVAIGCAVGLVLAVLIVILIYMFDNTVKDIEEFEDVTGVSVLAHLEK